MKNIILAIAALCICTEHVSSFLVHRQNRSINRPFTGCLNDVHFKSSTTRTYPLSRLHRCDLCTLCMSTKSNNDDEISKYDAELAVGVLKELWFLPVLSFLSGLTPASRIVAESHVSRMPDCPIAHDIDTFLLWPAVANPKDRFLPPTIFQTPAAAITDESQYDVDWNAVYTAFFSTVATSLLYSSIMAVGVYFYIYNSKQDLINDDLAS